MQPEAAAAGSQEPKNVRSDGVEERDITHWLGTSSFRSANHIDFFVSKGREVARSLAVAALSVDVDLGRYANELFDVLKSL